VERDDVAHLPKLTKTKVLVIVASILVPRDYTRARQNQLSRSRRIKTHVEETVDDEESKEESDGLGCAGDVVSVRSDGDGTEDHSCESKLGGGNSRDLTEKVEPSDGPSNNRLVLSGDEVGGCRVETAIRGVGLIKDAV
jgi:hypothetical protein